MNGITPMINFDKRHKSVNAVPLLLFGRDLCGENAKRNALGSTTLGSVKDVFVVLNN